MVRGKSMTVTKTTAQMLPANSSCHIVENMVTSVFFAPDKALSSILTQVLIKTEACLS